MPRLCGLRVSTSLLEAEEVSIGINDPDRGGDPTAKSSPEMLNAVFLDLILIYWVQLISGNVA